MTKKEIIAKLTAEYHEEVAGIKNYQQMIIDIEPCDPTGKYRKILRAILKDEIEHAEYLYKVLIDMDAFIPDAIQKDLDDVASVKATM